MAIRKIKGAWYVDIRFNRKRYRRRSPEDSRAGAKAYEALILKKLLNGEPVDLEPAQPKKESEQRFDKFAWQWFDIYVKNNNKLSEIISKESVLKRHLIPFFGSSCLDLISDFQIEKYKSRKLKERLRKKTINNHLTVLGTCLKAAKEWHGLGGIPKVKLFKVPPGKFDFLTEEELQLILADSQGVWHDMILLAARTGLRLGELIGLRWEDINWDNKTLTVKRAIVRNNIGSPKSNKHRTIPLTNELFDVLLRSCRKSGYVFETRQGFPLSAHNCYLNIQKIRKKAGLRNIGWHVLRHSFASHLAMKGAPAIAIKELMGHTDIQTTMRYAHLAPSTLQSAISLLEPGLEFFGHQVGTGFIPTKFPDQKAKMFLAKINEKQGLNPVDRA